jgi:rhodanese-related sulfurtransferase
MQKRIVLAASLVTVLIGVAVFGLTLQQSTETGTPVISQEKLLERIDSDEEILILDVRTRREFDGGHVPGAKLIPHTEVMSRIDEIVEFLDKPVVVYCEAGGRARMAETQLREAGFTDLLHLAGDMRAWRANGHPVEK